MNGLHEVWAIVFFLVGGSPASELNVPTFQNTVCSIFLGNVNKKNSPCSHYEDGTDRVFWNIGT
jgi:hypothetical protein